MHLFINLGIMIIKAGVEADLEKKYFFSLFLFLLFFFLYVRACGRGGGISACIQSADTDSLAFQVCQISRTPSVSSATCISGLPGLSFSESFHCQLFRWSAPAQGRPSLDVHLCELISNVRFAHKSDSLRSPQTEKSVMLQCSLGQSSVPLSMGCTGRW